MTRRPYFPHRFANIRERTSEHHALYQVVRTSPDFVWIIDQDVGKSVTNDADWVVAQLLPLYPGKRIIYRDTDRNWDELCHDGHRFTGFAPARHLDPTNLGGNCQ